LPFFFFFLGLSAFGSAFDSEEEPELELDSLESFDFDPGAGLL